jgi:serine/threonine protein kinase
MGVVFRARDTKLKRDVALKVLTLPSEQVEAAVLHEARCLAQLSHPNVVALYDTGKIGTELFLTMEFVQGIDGRKVISGFKPTWQQSLKLFVGAGRGLAAAHAAGLEHGDFKPENLLISFDQRVLVADFGVAHLLWNLCSDTSTPVECDVGPVRARQVCGDGNGNDTDDDSSTCQAATYCDGFLWVDDEVCDDSNNEDTDDCLVDTCDPITCSGAAAEEEGNDECDDSDVSTTDDCVRVCMLPARGDGFLRTDNAPCDRNAIGGPGSVEYMAPERLLGGRGDARSDQFSFCVALWEFIYGVRPFDGAEGEELFSAIVNGELVRSELNEKVPGRVLEVIGKGLSWHAQDRWPDMKSLVRALEAVRSSDQRPRPRRLRPVMVALGLVVASSLVTAAMTLAPEDRAVQTAGFAELGDSLISLAGPDVVDARAIWAGQIAIVAARAGNVDGALRSLESAKRAELSAETSRELALASGVGRGRVRAAGHV